MKVIYKAHLALLASGLLFGLNYWIAKNLMPDPLLPRQIIFIRVSLAALFFWLLSRSIPKERISKKDSYRIAGAGTLGVTVNQIFFFEGLNITTPVDAAIIHASSPIMVLLLAAWFIKEKVTLLNVFGIFLGATGTLLLIFSGTDMALFTGKSLGNLFILLNIIAYALYLVLIKPVMQRYRPFTVMKWVFFYGFLTSFPFTVSAMPDLNIQAFTGKVIFSLVYVILGTTLLAYLLTIYGLKYLKASSVGYYIYLQPIMAGILGWFWFAEPISYIKLISAALIFSGVYFVNLKPGNRTLQIPDS